MSKLPSEFQQVTFQKELEKILKELDTRLPAVLAMASDKCAFQMSVHHVQDDVLYLNVASPSPRELKAGERLQLAFGLNDGQYVLVTTVNTATRDRIAAPLGSEVYRLQRRSNFRTPVPSGAKISFKLTSFKTSTAASGSVLTPVDLSAGGTRATWPAQSGVKPGEGDSLTGVMTLPGGRSLELFGVIRKLYPQKDGSLQIGVEFQNLSIRDEQTLLFVCMEFHRAMAPV
jgi:c-di-GMP-binding flagellar brake protein YcgR